VTFTEILGKQKIFFLIPNLIIIVHKPRERKDNFVSCLSRITNKHKNVAQGRKPGLVDSKLDSQSKGRGFKSHPILDGNGVKTMPGRLKYPILVHSMIEKKENTGS